jgi:hypothetical protein
LRTNQPQQAESLFYERPSSKLKLHSFELHRIGARPELPLLRTLNKRPAQEFSLPQSAQTYVDSSVARAKVLQTLADNYYRARSICAPSCWIFFLGGNGNLCQSQES